MTHYKLLQPADCCLHVIDTQETLMRRVHRAERVTRVIELLLDCAAVMDIPVLANTQYRKGLGPYGERLEKKLAGVPRPDKVEFSAYANRETLAVVDSFGKDLSTVILVGVETHICVYQSAVGILARGLTPWIVADGVSARSLANHELGLARLRQLGAVVGPAEMLVYELLGKAGTETFKRVLPHIVAFAGEEG